MTTANTAPNPPAAPARAPTGNAMPADQPATAAQAGAAGSAGAGTSQMPGAAGASMPSTMASASAGAGAGSMTPAGGMECSELSKCCSGLTDEDDREDCERVVERADAMRCTRERDEFCEAATMPTMPTTPGTMTGTPSEACMKLSTCCETFTRELQKRQCQEAVERADAERCTRTLERSCPELVVMPEEPACASLLTCCPMLTDERALEACRRALQEDEQRDCEQVSMSLCQ